MTHVKIKAAVTGGLLALGLVAGTGFASAHGGHDALRGTITSVGSNTTIQVQPSSGAPVTVTLTSATHVKHQLVGSTSDLVKGARVSLHFATGTTTVDAIQIDSVAGPKLASSTKPKTGTSGAVKPKGSDKHKTGIKSTTGTTKPVHTGTPRGAFGTVSSFDSNARKLTITGHNGQSTVTYTLASTVTITKTTTGQLSDLKQNQTVAIHLSHGSTTTAAEVTIIGA